MSVRATVSALLFVIVALNMTMMPPAYAQDNNQDKKKDGPKAVEVALDTVIQERTHQTVPVIGRLVAHRFGVVSVLSKGVVTEFEARVGDRVQKDDVLAKLLSDSLMWARELRRAEVDSAKASLVNAKTQASLRRQELKRLDNLKKSAAFSAARFEDAQKELAKAESDAARAEADIARATANLNLAQIDLDNAEIKAPYPGVVSAVHTEVGSYLNIGEPVVTLIDDTNMELEADVPASRILGLTPGTAVSFTTRDGQNKTAHVRAVVPNENPLTRTLTTRFELGSDTLLDGAAANQTVNILIPAGPESDEVTVHKDAIITKGGKQIVYVFEGGKAVLRTVTLGDSVGMRFMVLSGLDVGDRVVVRGNERLTAGQNIKSSNSQDPVPLPPAPAPAPAPAPVPQAPANGQ